MKYFSLSLPPSHISFHFPFHPHSHQPFLPLPLACLSLPPPNTLPPLPLACLPFPPHIALPPSPSSLASISSPFSLTPTLLLPPISPPPPLPLASLHHPSSPFGLASATSLQPSPLPSLPLTPASLFLWLDDVIPRTRKPRSANKNLHALWNTRRDMFGEYCHPLKLLQEQSHEVLELGQALEENGSLESWKRSYRDRPCQTISKRAEHERMELTDECSGHLRAGIAFTTQETPNTS